MGTQVRFEETAGRKGPQASTVRIIDKPGLPETGLPAPPRGWEAAGRLKATRRKRPGKAR